MISFEVIFLSILLGIVVNYILSIHYLRGLRGERKGISDTVLISCSIVWGSIVYLIMYAVFSEIRIEDRSKKDRLLISQITILVIEVIALILLFYFGVITIPPLTTPEEGGEETLNLYLNFLRNRF